MKKKVVDQFWNDHMEAVLHYAYKEYDPNSKTVSQMLTQMVQILFLL